MVLNNVKLNTSHQLTLTNANSNNKKMSICHQKMVSLQHEDRTHDKLQIILYNTFIKYSIVNIITLHTHSEQQIL